MRRQVPIQIVDNFINNDVNTKVISYAKINKIIYRESDFKRSPAMKIIREH